LALWFAGPVAACVGDCDGEGSVSVDELVAGVSIALGMAPVSRCTSFDEDASGAVGVEELIAAIANALTGCSATPTSTPDEPVTPTPTAVNQPPIVDAPPVYRTFAGYPIAVTFDATDPEGATLSFEAVGPLPAGATFAADTGVLRWTPSLHQIGPFEIPFRVVDAGGLGADAVFAVQVSPADACTIPACSPDTGCTAEPVPHTLPCCQQGPAPRVPEIAAACPQGWALFAGSNIEGFGRLNSCQKLRVYSSLQTGTFVRLHIEARCVDPAAAQIDARLALADGVLFERSTEIDLTRRNDGYLEARSLIFDLQADGNPASLEGKEAELSLRLIDRQGVTLARSVRVVLTLQRVPDLPDLD
jgi:hypothetical protein